MGSDFCQEKIMSEQNQSRVFLHADGYIEMVFIGLQASGQLRTLIGKAKSLAEAQEDKSVNFLVDARNGHIGRDARTFTLLMDIGWVRNLKNIVFLYDNDPTNENSARPSDIVVSVLTNTIRVKPRYINDEDEARRIVSGKEK
jgi:hypothetical protein